MSVAKPYECHSQSVRPSHSPLIAVTNCHDPPLTSTGPNVTIFFNKHAITLQLQVLKNLFNMYKLNLKPKDK